MSVLELFHNELQRSIDRQERRRDSDRARVTRLFAFLSVIVALVFGFRGLPDSSVDKVPYFVGVGLALIPLILIARARGARSDVDLRRCWRRRRARSEDETREAIIVERLWALRKNEERLRKTDRLLTRAEVVTAVVVVYFFFVFFLTGDDVISVRLVE